MLELSLLAAAALIVTLIGYRVGWVFGYAKGRDDAIATTRLRSKTHHHQDLPGA